MAPEKLAVIKQYSLKWKGMKNLRLRSAVGDDHVLLINVPAKNNKKQFVFYCALMALISHKLNGRNNYTIPVIELFF